MKPLLVTLLFLLSFQARAFDHHAWDQLLHTHVYYRNDGKQSTVDYQGFADDHEKLSRYLQSLSSVTRKAFESWPKNRQLAFLINTYNAWTVELILTEYPAVGSIKDLGSFFRSPWKKTFIPLFSDTYSLDDIEHGMIRGSGTYQEPRIHFAVNCASIGCPALRAEAYTGSKLEQQLDEQTRLFLADHSRNYYQNGRLYLSPIFDWYREDFEKGWQGYQSLEDFLLDYADALALDETARQKLQQKKLAIYFTDYNWQLNDRRKQ